MRPAALRFFRLRQGPRKLALALALLASAPAAAAGLVLERVSTAVPFPRGLAMVEGSLYVLARGRVRGAGGVTAAIDDRAGTIYVLDPAVAEPAGDAEISEAVRRNGVVVAPPTVPPFRLWDRQADPPESDRLTDRPYCTLRYHAPTDSFYICAFSGIDKKRTPDDSVAFSKNLTDALLRYDRRRGVWSEVERHDIEAGGSYPHHDPRFFPPPHGWLNGPDNCLPQGSWLYAVSKDNSRLVKYDLRGIQASPDAAAPPSEVVLTERVHFDGAGEQAVYGYSALACHTDWLYVGARTSSVIFRIELDADGRPVQPVLAQLVARFDPYDPTTGSSANITDLAFDDRGRLYVISAKPARVYRFTPDPQRVFDARDGRQPPWADLAALTGRPRMKSENILVHGAWLYVTSGDGYGYQKGADGTVYRVRVDD